MMSSSEPLENIVNLTHAHIFSKLLNIVYAYKCLHVFIHDVI